MQFQLPQLKQTFLNFEGLDVRIQFIICCEKIRGKEENFNQRSVCIKVSNCFFLSDNPCQGLHLLDNNLTTARLLEIIAAESRDPKNLSSCMDLEVPL